MTAAVIFIEPLGGSQAIYSAFWSEILPFTSINLHVQEPLEQLSLNVTLNEYDIFTVGMAGLPALVV